MTPEPHLPIDALRHLVEAVKIEARLLGTSSVRIARCSISRASSFEKGARFARRLVVNDAVERVPALRPIVAREIRAGRRSESERLRP